MKLLELHIDRFPTYGDTPNQLRGYLSVKDETSEHKIALTMLEISNLVDAIKDTVSVRMAAKAMKTAGALDEVRVETKLLTVDGELL